MPGSETPEAGSNDLSRNERFLKSVNNFIESNLSNDQFGVEQLAESLNISRTQLFRRLQKLTGKNISQYIREYRLHKALELLKKNVASASEIAYQVGFSSPSYFNKCFHEYFDYTPGEVMKNPQREKESLIAGTEKDERYANKNWRQKIWPNKFARYLLFVFVGVILISILAVYLFKLSQQATSTKTARWKLIAVLPFRNDSPDMNNEYICNGIMDEISNRLEKISGLRVMSRQSVEKYRDSDKDSRRIAHELGVDNLITGSFRKAGDSITVNIQLVEANNGNMLWSEIYHDRYTEKIYEFESHVVKQVANVLNIVITPEEERGIDKDFKTDFRAYDYILRAIEIERKLWETHNSDFSTTLQYLTDKALEIDPESSLANRWKGVAFATEGWYAKRSLRMEKFDSALYYADKALELDPGNAMAYNLKANVYAKLGNKDEAKTCFLSAIELVPNDPIINEAFGRNLTEGRKKRDFMEGMSYRRKAIMLRSLNDPATMYQLGAYYHLLEEYTKAEAYLLKSIRLGYENPSYNHNSILLIRNGNPWKAVQFLDSVNFEDYDRSYHGRSFYANIEMNNLEKAEEHYKKFMSYNVQLPKMYTILLGYMYIKTNREAEAISILDTIRKQSEKILSDRKSYYDLFWLFWIYTILDEPKQALEYLIEMEKSFLLLNHLQYIKSSDLFQNIQNDQEFKVIMKRAEAENEAVRAQIMEMEELEGFDF
jgi:TolB-like protein/AraC-like DNA-binding protein/Flp pilus assembly protein TadD